MCMKKYFVSLVCYKKGSKLCDFGIEVFLVQAHFYALTCGVVHCVNRSAVSVMFADYNCQMGVFYGLA